MTLADTHRQEVEAEHVVHPQGLQLQDDRCHVAALHLWHCLRLQLAKFRLCVQPVAPAGPHPSCTPRPLLGRRLGGGAHHQRLWT